MSLLGITRFRTSLVCIMLAMVLVFMAVMPVASAESAADSGVAPCFEYASLISATLSISSSGVAECIGEVSTYNRCGISITVKLWQKNNNVWSVLKKWSGSVSSDNLYTVDNTYSVSAGTYKVTVAATIKGPDGGTENLTKSTAAKTFGNPSS